MAIIDKGEKHLFIRRLLQSDDSVIDWGNVVDITFELSFLGEEIVKTWSKVVGGVTQSGDSVRFELDSGSIDKGTYYLKATLVVNDETWNSGTSDDITWETEKIQVIETPTPTNPSSSTGDLKFDVVPEPVLEAPTDAPGAGTPTTTNSTASTPFSPVARASFYQYEIESNPGVWVSNGASTVVELSSLSGNTTDRVRLRGGNSTDTGPASAYVSYTTKPDSPVLSFVSATESAITLSLSAVSGSEAVTYFAKIGTDAYQEVSVGNITFSGLADAGTSYTFTTKATNASGDSDEATFNFSTAPAIPPTISNGALDITATDISYTVDFVKATDDDSDNTTIQYFLVEGSETALQDPELIQALGIVDSGTDVSQLSGEGSAGNVKFVNVYAKDITGNVSVYNDGLVVFLDPEIISVDALPSQISDDEGTSGSISWTVESSETSAAQELCTPSSSDTNIVTLSNIDKNAQTADYTLVATGNATINVVADLDGTTDSIPVSVAELVEVTANQSDTNTFDAV